MKKSLQNSMLGPVLILVVAGFVIGFFWHKDTSPVPAPFTTAANNSLPHSVLHYPGQDAGKPSTTPCYAGDAYRKFLADLKTRGLSGGATGKLTDGRQFFLYQGAANGAFVLLALDEDGQHQTEVCQLGAGQDLHAGVTP